MWKQLSPALEIVVRGPLGKYRKFWPPFSIQHWLITHSLFSEWPLFQVMFSVFLLLIPAPFKQRFFVLFCFVFPSLTFPSPKNHFIPSRLFSHQYNNNIIAVSSPQLRVRDLTFKICDLLACKQTMSTRWMRWIKMKDRPIEKFTTLSYLCLIYICSWPAIFLYFATQIKYKEDLQILKGMGCFLMDTPDMVRSRHLRKLWVSVGLPNPWWLAPHSFKELGERISACSYF